MTAATCGDGENLGGVALYRDLQIGVYTNHSHITEARPLALSALLGVKRLYFTGNSARQQAVVTRQLPLTVRMQIK